MSKDNRFVNGPVNTIRLRGDVNGKTKIIYLFMDFHADIRIQSQCYDIRSTDIDKYLVNTFDKVHKLEPHRVFDLLIELNPLYSVRFGDPINRGKYLFGQTVSLFNKAKNIKSRKVYMSKELPNVRLHYADIREYTSRKYDDIWVSLVNLIDKIQNYKSVDYHIFSNILDGLNLIYSHAGFIYNLLYKGDIKKPKSPVIFTNDQKTLIKYTSYDYNKIAQKLIYKIKKQYNNPDIKSKINKIISTDIHNIFKESLGNIENIIDYLNNLLKKFEPYKNMNYRKILVKQDDGLYDYGIKLDDIFCNISKLDNFLSNFMLDEYSLQLMDLYLLRRVLDKNYINNAIIYTGASHTVNYIRLLVKYFDFEVTHYSYLKNNNIENAHKLIKESVVKEELNELFFPPIIKQCSNLSSFPDNFN